MRHFPLIALLSLFSLLGLAGCQTASHTMGHDAGSHSQKMMVQEPWSRASAGMAKAGAAFMTVMNHGSADDRLISASASISERVELHTHIMEGNIMRMRQVPHIDLPKGEAVVLKPGGLHVMFMNLKAPLKEGGHFPLTLNFEKSGSVTVKVMIKGAAAGAMGSMHKPGKHSMH
jgi:periplasmic copper chaperone A